MIRGHVFETSQVFELIDYLLYLDKSHNGNYGS